MSTTAFVCRKCKGHGKLVRDLGAHTEARVREVGCQNICSNAVVGVRRDGATVWLEKVNSGKRRRSLSRFINDRSSNRLPGRLRDLVVRKRSAKQFH